MTADTVVGRRASYRGGESGLLEAGSSGGYQHLEVHPASAARKGKKNGGSKRAKKSKESKKAGRAKKPKKSKVEANKGGGRRLLQASADGALLPACSSLFVPTGAGDELTGTYDFQGHYSDRRPVYAAANGNKFFAKDEEGVPTTWYITQASPNSKFFLSLESAVFEPADLKDPEDMLQPWVRNNDPTCGSCISKLHMSCSAWTADVIAAAPVTTTPAPNDPVPSSPAENENSTMSTAETVVPPATTPAPTDLPTDTTMVDTSAVGGCANLKINNGEDRAGVYSLSGVDGEGGVVFRNGRPSYAAVGADRTDVVFSTTMNVCASGYGVVDADWAVGVEYLPPTSTVNTVFLMYVAENVGVDTADDAAASSDNDGCEVPVWLLVADGAESLDAAGENTFLSVSGVDDPSEATSWAKFTPATSTTRPTLEENFWIDFGCADAGEVEEALAATADTRYGGEEEQGTASLSSNSTALVPVGSEPNARWLSTMFAL
ncbi:expressed unknown protein [Ectocarpus siliculosus]|uniref:Uncharacterized protein n=1 Tax=Ectocarpus siliculosus TaxID=2880 RepID=D7G0N9_ECTSI|nr:expressed unknown protein [Ectocarpus siliculosus]|eukprot:CBJ33068.1 expressed unknown protein [Ectocarpus siliculosus]